ncbi:MAG: GNAT family N-acetyltransferase [Bosea sp. (in: a-proteobacteria)]
MSGPDLTGWSPRKLPKRIVLDGRYARLEPIDPKRHGDDLFAASMAPGAAERHRWLFEAPMERETFQEWLEERHRTDDPLMFVVIDKATRKPQGRQSLMRIDTLHGVIEIGSILWGPAMARSRVATEALYLFARHAFDDLRYRRFEWKCNAQNEPSKRAAARFGFTYEGTFRNHMVMKGKSRDTAWFSMIDSEWPALKAAYERWLDLKNFDEDGKQINKLEARP